ncbi:MAG: 5'/3'-nucleotidase SurE [Gammaproteobacteria bacterium]|nr:5'/3'-nucleotidase SurE [Gammaproteobacteria bacterium]
MHILLSNDDGYYAPGLLALRDALQALGKVTVVAPDRDRSGASNSLTLDAPVRVVRQPDGIYRTSGTPTDCVHVAITGLLDAEPDIVVSGINSGPNMGDDVIYSGTVAAAMEGRFLGLPAIAVSMASFEPQHFDTAAEIVRRLVLQLRDKPLAADSILNVNVPDVPLDQIRGIQATRLGHRHKAEPAVPTVNPRGLKVFWIGPAGPEQDAGPGTDFYAVRENFVSVTPIHVDLTRHSALDMTAVWLNEAGLT